MAFSIGSGVSSQATMRPVLVRLIRPASDSTSRCFITAGNDMGRGCASSLTEALSPLFRRASNARRVGSARAAKVRSRTASEYLTIRLSVMPTRAVCQASSETLGFQHVSDELGRFCKGRELLERALARGLVGTEANELGAVAKAVAADLVVADLDHELRLHRAPLFGAFGAPPAWSSRRLAGEARRRDEGLELRRQRRAVLVGDGRGETDMVELAVSVVEPEQQRADLIAAATIAESADHAVRSAMLLDLHHRPLARDVRSAALFSHDAVERRAALA